MKNSDIAVKFSIRHMPQILISACIGLVGAVILLFILSFAAGAIGMPEQLSLSFSLAALLVGAIIAGFTGSRKVPLIGLLAGAVCGLTLFLILFITGMMISLKVFSVSTPVWSLIFALAGGALGGIIGKNTKRR